LYAAGNMIKRSKIADAILMVKLFDKYEKIKEKI